MGSNNENLGFTEDPTTCRCSTFVVMGQHELRLSLNEHHPRCPMREDKRIINSLLDCIEYEAHQGDGIPEEFADAYEKACAFVQRLSKLQAETSA